MLSVSEAEKIILSHTRDYGTEQVPFQSALGRVLAQDIRTDRDLPPYDRVTMDGIAIRYTDYAAGCRTFQIAATQAAGDAPPTRLAANACFEIMTGAMISAATDTVIPYEHLRIVDGAARLLDVPMRQGQNIHRQGTDRRQGEVVASAGRIIGPTEISMAASVGLSELWVKKLPRVVVLSSGDELVDVTDSPLPHQIRRSNNYAIQAALRRYGIEATLRHLPDHLDVVTQEIARCQSDFDVLLLSGGVSMGKFDYVPQALEACGVARHFHKVRQRPGKPFWFGTYGERGVVFALPGNPVSTFLCLYRYFLPWLEVSLGLPPAPPLFAVLERDLRFEPPLTYFLQVKLEHDNIALIRAVPVEGRGSGDFANLLDADGFLELPAEQTEFVAGDVFRAFRFRG